MPVEKRSLSIWLSPADLAQLVRLGLEHPDLRYETFYGVSRNERLWWDNARTYAYGCRPTGCAEDYRDEALAGAAGRAPDPVTDYFQGDAFCSEEFDGIAD